MIETNNTISHPTGPEYQLVVGEGATGAFAIPGAMLIVIIGTYVLKEDLHLATPPPHPSEAPVVNLNPLATTPQPASAGTKISLLSLSSRATPPLLSRIETNRSARSEFHTSIQEHPDEGRVSADKVPGSSDAGTSTAGSLKPVVSIGSAPAFGEGNSMLLPVGKDSGAGKRRKPKNNIAKSNSSFISRCIVNENLGKRLQERPGDGYFAFANINRAFQWLDLSSSQKVQCQNLTIYIHINCVQVDHLTKILFTKGHSLCHDVNQTTKASNHIDLIMGFSTGEIIWFEPISQKYTRLNKNVSRA
jgi:hypothetical protein